jgi:hypothetical protein
MGSPPTFVGSYPSASWITATSPKTVSVPVTAGDSLVVAACAADMASDFSAPSDGVNTYALATVYGGSAGNVRLSTYRTIAATTTTLTVSVSTSAGTDHWGFAVARWSGSAGFGDGEKWWSTGIPAIDQETTANNAAMLVAIGDWVPVNGSGRVWKTVNGITPSTGNGLELVYQFEAGVMAFYLAYYSDAGVAGPQSWGLTGPTGQTYVIEAVEIWGDSLPGAPVQPLIRSPQPAEGLMASAPFVSPAPSAIIGG